MSVALKEARRRHRKHFFGGLGCRAGERKLSAMRAREVAGNRLAAWCACGGEDKPMTSCLGFIFSRLGLEALPV
jgi:hypothetical protein